MLYAGVVLFLALALLTAGLLWRAFEERAGQARAAAVFDLVATRTPMRPADAPGAVAWLRRVIDRAAAGAGDLALTEPADSIPPPLAGLVAAIRDATPIDVSRAHVAPESGPPHGARRQQLVQIDGTVAAVTRRRAVTDDTEVAAAAAFLADAEDRARRVLSAQPLPRVFGDRAIRPVRIYVVFDDSTLVSLPWTDAGRRVTNTTAASDELALLSARPTVPSFAPDEFFFHSSGDAYSGFYLDLGGRGLVSTVTLPRPMADGRSSIVALDLAFDIDWSRVARLLDAPIAGATVTTAASMPSWSELADGLRDADPSLHRALTDAARRGLASEPQSATMRHALLPSGALAAFHVSDRMWLVAWFPQTVPVFPAAAIVLLGAVLVVLLAGFEINRRRADRARRTAERALSEKQNLLNTMQVPLVVVDPNTDAIVSANDAADAIGFRAGRRFADLVWPDRDARAHYQNMQVASPEPRRAYGIPVAVATADGTTVERYAIVRSVAVTAPIEALHADERHRLGILIIVDEEADLALFAEDLALRAHRDERRRLAGLLTHGVDTLARVLAHALAHAMPAAFVQWLADYLERRISVTAWLLDHWDAAGPLPRAHIVDATQAHATAARLEEVLSIAAADRGLRERLHWDNGTLSEPAGTRLRVDIDWPDDVDVACPVRGGFGLFVNELVANAVRHGKPGTAPRLSIACDRVRGELACLIDNDAAGSVRLDRADAYGGLAIVRAMARLFEWRDLQWTVDGARVSVRWSMPFGTRRRGEAD